jgi:hypothetical protein
MTIKFNSKRAVIYEKFVPGTLYIGRNGEIFLYTIEGGKHKYESEERIEVVGSPMMIFIVAMPLTSEEAGQYIAEKRASFERVSSLVRRCAQSSPLETGAQIDDSNLPLTC